MMTAKIVEIAISDAVVVDVAVANPVLQMGQTPRILMSHSLMIHLQIRLLKVERIAVAVAVVQLVMMSLQVKLLKKMA
jgi:hypothetical protein